jgi:hypothetical protein
LLRRSRWTGHLELIREIRYAYTILVGKPEWKDHLKTYTRWDILDKHAVCIFKVNSFLL